MRLTLRDVGLGLEPQGADKLFELFYTNKSGGFSFSMPLAAWG